MIAAVVRHALPRYPIGSNTKLFTAVAVWQLHRAGKLSVYDQAAKYINATELGLDGPWCPRVYGANDTGADCRGTYTVAAV
jgi:CubicO group peptidase (beta-lactamase class C family)